jgi:aspartate carbamoyltransferase catalytic subunit
MFKHILSTQQFSDRKTVEDIFQNAKKFEAQDTLPKNHPSIESTRRILRNQILASVFYEPSTRTRFSFETAAYKLGAEVISSESAGQFSSAIKGETIEDSIRVIAGYADMIVLRHSEKGSVGRAAEVSPVPIINAGDGAGEHPTQALLDLYTIEKELGTIDDLKVAMVGDLLNGRTIHSLIKLLANTKNPQIFLVSPPELKLPEEYLEFLKANNIKFIETSNLNEILPQSDVVYMTRIQKERFTENPEEYERVKDSFIFDQSSLQLLPRKSVLMHPLPRVNEISTEVDKDPRAAYFRQAKNGLYVRMSLLEMLENEQSEK